MQFSIVASSTCFVRKSASISLIGFLPSEILPSVTIVCTQRNTVSMCFSRPSPRRLPISIPAVAFLRIPCANSARHHQKNHTTAPASQLLTGGYKCGPERSPEPSTPPLHFFNMKKSDSLKIDPQNLFFAHQQQFVLSLTA